MDRTPPGAFVEVTSHMAAGLPALLYAGEIAALA